MINHAPALAGAALLATSLATFTDAAAARPFSGALAIKNAAPSIVEALFFGIWLCRRPRAGHRALWSQRAGQVDETVENSAWAGQRGHGGIKKIPTL
jgi:hypothetical protein